MAFKPIYGRQTKLFVMTFVEEIRTLTFLLIFSLSYSCSKTVSKQGPPIDHGEQMLRQALLCACIYDAFELDYDERQSEGSLGMYIQKGDFPIEDFEEMLDQLQQEIFKSDLRSSAGATLDLGKCLKGLDEILPAQ